MRLLVVPAFIWIYAAIAVTVQRAEGKGDWNVSMAPSGVSAIASPSPQLVQGRQVSRGDGAVALKQQAKYPSLKAVACETLLAHFGKSDKQYQSLDELANSFPVADAYKRSAGIFVTFSKHGKTRACWGYIYPRYVDLVKGTVYATEEALTKDYRFGKVKSSELNSLKVQVTVIDSLTPISSISGQDPMRSGLFVRQGGKTGLLLPGEARDAFYQLVQCKLKAGIPSNEQCQMYRIEAHVYN